MKKIIILFSLIMAMMTNAQNQRFIYEYKFIIDSTAKEKQETETMLLDIAPKGSKFYSKDYFESDSIMRAMIDKQSQSGNFNLSGFKFKGKIRYSIEKMYPEYSLNFFTTLASEEYLVQESRKQDWKILSEKERIGEFNTQKAVCDFAGRKWTAWFTTDLPIQDGPYKFHGLPGLIVKVEDNTHSHSFELKGSKKLQAGYEWKSTKDKERYNSIIILNEKKYKKAFKDYCNDPIKSERQMMAQGVLMEMIDESGKLMDPEKALKDQEAVAKANIKKENNILELDMLK
ncbi:GLPGLI family protein [Chryseobacterium viscerum]|uniref:GLPGLI family protein n=1 Tax=Chryseobacterium viscerum TaxID=1037377 RepID=A0A5N4BWM4_9FLAO|nr:GLPGLI family protein [Chryseobacterium viscerum]KAB1232821.1 GLPGLI family protein [Chryseobacterium viscerum]